MRDILGKGNNDISCGKYGNQAQVDTSIGLFDLLM